MGYQNLGMYAPPKKRGNSRYSKSQDRRYIQKGEGYLGYSAVRSVADCKSGKRAYDKRGAVTAMHARRAGGVLLRVYECPQCGRWHLTHQVNDIMK
jgi:ribosomal protein L32